MKLARKAVFVVWITICVDVSANVSLSSLDPAMPELPKSIHFDCMSLPGIERETGAAIDRQLIIPRHFSLSGTDENWLNWNVKLSSGEYSGIFPYVTISFGEYGSEISLFEDWESISTPSFNHLGVEVRYKKADPSKEFDFYELLLFRDGLFLKSTSAVPIDWVSLLSCFE